MKPSEYCKFIMEHWTDEELIEIRMTPVKDVNTYAVIGHFTDLYPQVYCNKKKSLFFNKSQVIYIDSLINMLHNYNCQEKVCYSTNPRIKINDEIIVSGLDNIDYITTIVFDIERVKDKSAEDEDKKIVMLYVRNFIKNIENEFRLMNPTIIDSGAGFHLIYRIKPVKFTLNRKDWLRSYIDSIIKYCDTGVVHIDPAVKDISRVLGLPGSKNPKYNKEVTVVHQSNYLNMFNIKSTVNKKPKVNVEVTLNKEFDITKSVEMVIILSDPPEGERNNILGFALKLLIKKYNIVDYKTLERDIKLITREYWSLNPQRGLDNKVYTPYIIINYMLKNLDWMKKNNLDFELLKQKALTQ